MSRSFQGGGGEKAGESTSSSEDGRCRRGSRGRNRRRGVEQLHARRFERGSGGRRCRDGRGDRRRASTEGFRADLDSIHTDDSFENLLVLRRDGEHLFAG
ncbi:MAG: hypothetical protein CBB69_001845 [Phycisphaera sp. TMED9]|nr:MAG: hypothetical protein CBB69_001845 [Phycisphaera sp. TMED9]